MNRIAYSILSSFMVMGIGVGQQHVKVQPVKQRHVVQRYFVPRSCCIHQSHRASIRYYVLNNSFTSPVKTARSSAGKAVKPTASTQRVQRRQAQSNHHALCTKTLDLTNAFRTTKRLPSLQWDQRLADIAEQHSINMGTGKVPFGHHGFDQRIKSLNVFVRSAAENVFMGNMPGDSAAIAVDGWIKSRGHYKNIVGDFTHCGVGIYRNAKGYWYYTQIFARYS